MRHLQHIVFLAAIALVMPVQARHFEIGAPIVSPPWGTADLLRKSVEHLRWKLPAHTFTLKWTDVQSLESDLYEGKLDLAVLPSGPLNPLEHRSDEFWLPCNRRMPKIPMSVLPA